VRARFAPFTFRNGVFDWQRTYVAGVVNVTPDSFSDGGRWLEPELAVGLAARLIEQGADLIDVGGESTRPGADSVTAEEEMDRVLPVIVALAARVAVPIAVDTTKARVAEAAIAAGAEVVNDVSGGRFDPEIVQVTDQGGAWYICGHVRGDSLAEVHHASAEVPSFADVLNELSDRLAALPASLRSRTIVDPGLGFGKDTAANLELIRRAGELAAGLYCPVMLGPSRKRFLGELTGAAVHDRDDATVGAALAGAAAGADLLRVHNVARLKPALTVFEAARGKGL
jgi:dihydropteroate synthase